MGPVNLCFWQVPKKCQYFWSVGHTFLSEAFRSKTDLISLYILSFFISLTFKKIVSWEIFLL